MKIRKTSEILWVCGIFFVALGVAICSKTDLGVSMIAAPTFIVHEAVEGILPSLSVGVTEYILQGIILIILCFAVRRFNWRYLTAFAAAVVYGYVLDFILWMLGDVTFTSVWLRWVMLIAGDTITAFGVACFFKTYMPLQVHELFVAEFSDRYRLNIHKTKWCFDISLLVISVVLAFLLFGDAADFEWGTIYKSAFHSIGLGTVVTTFINSPIIKIWSKLIDNIFDPTAMFPKLEKVLKR